MRDFWGERLSINLICTSVWAAVHSDAGILVNCKQSMFSTLRDDNTLKFHSALLLLFSGDHLQLLKHARGYIYIDSSPSSREALAEEDITEFGNKYGELQEAPSALEAGKAPMQAKQMVLRQYGKTSSLYQTKNALTLNQSLTVALFLHNFVKIIHIYAL